MRWRRSDLPSNYNIGGCKPAADTRPRGDLSALFNMVICWKGEFEMPLVKCPMCGKMVEYAGNEFRPFCSERCKVLDLGAWADEKYNLPAEHTEMTEEDIANIERAAERKGHNGH